MKKFDIGYNPKYIELYRIYAVTRAMFDDGFEADEVLEILVDDWEESETDGVLFVKYWLRKHGRDDTIKFNDSHAANLLRAGILEHWLEESAKETPADDENESSTGALDDWFDQPAKEKVNDI